MRDHKTVADRKPFMRICTDRAFERLIMNRVDAAVAAAVLGNQREISELREEGKRCSEALIEEREKNRRIVARLRAWESKFHQLEISAADHDLFVEERPEVPAKPGVVVLKKRKRPK